MEYQYTWETCPEHEWKYPIDDICDTAVYCTKCGMPGDKDRNTGEVFFPAT